MNLVVVNANIARRNKDNRFTGDNQFEGEMLFTEPHGTFYSTQTQAIADTSAAQEITLNNEDDKTKLTHSTSVNSGRIYADYTGSYEITFSGIADISTAPGNKHLEVWLCVDGTDIPMSNTRVEIPFDNVEMTVAVSWITDLTAGQYFCLKTWGDATTCQWLYTAAASTPTRPACPSVIVTVKRVSSYPV